MKRLNERAKELVKERGLTYVHPFDDLDLIAGQGTVGLEILEDWPDVDVVVVPIGGGGLISGTSMALKTHKPNVKVIGVESTGAPGMLESVRAGHLVTLPSVTCIIDGLRVKRVGETTLEVVRRYVDEIVTLSDEGDLRGPALGHGALQARRRGRGGGSGRRVAPWPHQGRPRCPRRMRTERWKRESGSAQGIALELSSNPDPASAI